MTAKQAIKARCLDCSGRICTIAECVLKGLAKKKGKVKKSVIFAYCRWCMNGHPFRVCSSPDCAIYQYRTNPGKPSLDAVCTEKVGGTEGVNERAPENPGNDTNRRLGNGLFSFLQ
ncbi:hypothetical protein LQZ19_05195 [Treponema primitia]|uniref:hypothetical protein n=1 Tax=Treponema primitia TaxID=88058 RepID=UPI00397FA2BE